MSLRFHYIYLLIFCMTGHADVGDYSILGFSNEIHSLDWHKSHAIPLTQDSKILKDCSKPSEPQLMGSFNGKTYYSSTYSGATGLCAILIWNLANKGDLIPISALAVESFDSGVVDQPQHPELLIIEKKAIIRIRRDMPGTGAFNEDRYFILSGNGTRPILKGCWVEEIRARLPSGYGVWKGIRPDFAKMPMKVPVWKNGDGNCCASGGHLQFSLELIDNQFRINYFKFVSAAGTPKKEIWSGSNLPSQTEIKLYGKIGEGQNFIRMNIHRVGNEVKGSYHYTRYCKSIELKGHVVGDGKMLSLKELNSDGITTGEFSLNSDSSGGYVGSWTSTTSRKHLSVNLKR